MASFEQMPIAIENIETIVQQIISELKELRASQPINEPPIDSKELMKRLAISEPTLIRMRKRKAIPFLEVCGHYRYVWIEVVKALQKNKK